MRCGFATGRPRSATSLLLRGTLRVATCPLKEVERQLNGFGLGLTLGCRSRQPTARPVNRLLPPVKTLTQLNRVQHLLRLHLQSGQTLDEPGERVVARGAVGFVEGVLAVVGERAEKLL